jgi:hypothetical protein
MFSLRGLPMPVRNQNRILLAGASAAVLSLAVASAASAAPLLLGPAGTGGTVTNTGFANFVVVDSYVLTGDLINGPTGIIGSGTQPIAISIQNNAQITGSLINDAGGQILAQNVGILVNQSDVPFIVNDGLIQVGPGAPITDFGLAAGVIVFSSEDQTNITNNADFNVDAIGTETGVATADATAIGIGAGQILFGRAAPRSPRPSPTPATSTSPCWPRRLRPRMTRCLSPSASAAPRS